MSALISLSICRQSYNQHLQFTNITSKQGLAQNIVNCTIQDRKGFMWIGTAQGLQRYDGHHFKLYHHQLKNNNSLSHNYVLTLLEDRQGYIWIGTLGGGLNRFNPDTEEFTRFRHQKDDKNSIRGQIVNTLYEDQEGKIWAGFHTGYLSCFDPNTQKFKHFSLQDKFKLVASSIFSIVNDHNKGLWLGTAQGLVYFDKKKEVYSYNSYINKTQSKHYLNNAIYSLFRDRTQPHILWLGTFHMGLIKFDTQAKQIVKRWEANSQNKASLQTNSVWSFLQDRQGTYWVGTKMGFYKLDPKTNEFTLFSPNAHNPNSIAGNYIQHIFQDKAGSIWLCSYDHGISLFTPNFNHSYAFKNNFGQVSSFCEDREGNIWMGVKRGSIGLAKFNRNDGSLKTFRQVLKNSHSVAADEVNVLLTDIDGSLWIGTYGKGLYHYKPQSGALKHYTYQIKRSVEINLANANIGAIYQDKDDPDKLWISALSVGVFQLSKKLQKFVKYYPSINFSQASISGITKDEKGYLWLATRKGLNKVDLKTDVITHYLYSPDDKHSISNNYITSLHIGQQNVLWIGTWGGLNKLDLEKEANGKFQRYPYQQHLSGNVIHKIIEDKVGNLWLSTNKGVICFDKHKGLFKSEYKQLKLLGNEHQEGSGFLSKDGAIFLGGNNGFSSFYPEKVGNNNYVAPIVFTDFRLFNKPVETGTDKPLTRPVWATDTIELSFQENVISLEFTVLDYTQAEKNTYEVFLENFDQDWYSIGNKYQVTYANLPAGHYLFRVKSTNQYNQEACMVLIVHPPWWNTLWFKVGLTSLLMVALVGGYFLIRLYRTKKRRITTFASQTHKEAEAAEKIEETETFIREETSDLEPKTTVLAAQQGPRSLFKNQAEIDQLRYKLQEVMETQALYKNERLSLPILAEKIETTDKKLSELLNKELNTNFYEYINLYRIKVFKERIEKGEGQYKKLISIAFDSGFYSKSTFNRIFKKHTGLTPTQFKEKIEASNKQTQ